MVVFLFWRRMPRRGRERLVVLVFFFRKMEGLFFCEACDYICTKYEAGTDDDLTAVRVLTYVRA